LPQDLRSLGTDVYVHTVNDFSQAKSYLKRGANAIYTDSLIR